MKRGHFLLLLIILSALQVGTMIDVTALDALFIGDDHPKFFSYSVENARLLLDYGTPFGFNHDFQGGIPTVYLRSCFLELIPFALLFGYPLGYQLMLIVFLILIPLSFFYLVHQWTGNEELALIAAFLASFYAAGDYVKCGMTPAIIGYALAFLTLLFFTRYLTSPKPYLFPLLLTAAVLAYTHLIFFVLTGIICVVVVSIALLSKPAGMIVRRIAGFAAILTIVLADLGYQLIHYRDYWQLDYTCGTLHENPDRWRRFLFEHPSMGLYLLLATLVLGLCFRRVSDRDLKHLIGGSLLLSVVFLITGLINDLTQAPIFIGRIGSFTPYVFLFDLALILWLPAWRQWQSVSLTFTALILFFIYPFSHTLQPTVKGVDEVDRSLGRILRRGDFVLLENRAHICSVAGADNDASYPLSHWETYLQSFLGVKMLAHMGEDAQPYNSFRHMYLVNGRYQGATLDRDSGAALASLMARWGVGKACVWSPAAVAYFQGSPSFAPLGKSTYYSCFQGTFPLVTDIVTGGEAEGELADVTPFSFRISLSGVKAGEKVIVNKNYFPFWSAYDQDGRIVPLKKEGQRISFEATRDGDIFFVFQRNRVLPLVALATLFSAGTADVVRLLAVRRSRRRTAGPAHP